MVATANSKRKVLSTKVYDRGYVLVGQTIVCYFKFDRTMINAEGKKEVMVGAEGMDVFHLDQGKPKTMASYLVTPAHKNK